MTTGDNKIVEPDLRDQLARGGAFLRRMLRFWPAVAIALALGALASAAFLFFKKPTYRSETVVLYSEGIKQNEGEESRDASRTVTMRLKEILTSRAELARVVSEFGLYPELGQAHGGAQAVDELRKHIDFKAPGGDSFSIAFEGTSPLQAKQVTERLAQLVIDQDSSLRKKQATTTRDFLELEKIGTEARLKDAEQALAAFMAAHPRFALDATPLSTGAAIRATMSQSPTAAPVPGSPFAPAPRPMAAGPRHAATDPASSTALHDATEEQGRATAALEAAQSRLTDLLGRFTPQYPDVRNAQAEVDRAKARVAAAGAELARVQAQPARPASPAQASVTAAAEAVAEGSPAPTRPPVVTPVEDVPRTAQARPGGVRAQPTPTPTPRAAGHDHDVVQLETDWVRLTRAVTEARQHQEHVESALFKADLSANSEAAGHGVAVSVIDPAYLPEKPVPPGRSIMVALILGCSLVLGLIAAAIGAAVDDRIFDYRDLAPLAPALVEVPRGLVGRAHG
jgi:capsular polysaccharide biosynthesis protein